MNITLKAWAKRIILIFLILALIPHLTTGCFQFRMNKSEVRKYFKDQTIKPNLQTIKTNTWDIHFAEIGNDTLPLILFVHGAPGSWSAFRHFLKDDELLQRAHMISVDRPGYGYSNFGRPEVELENQAALMVPLIHRNRSGKKAILIGHSLGGPIIARLAIDHPDKVSCLIMVAPSIAPQLEPKEWYRLPLYLPIVRWVLPTTIDMTNREIYHLKDELEEMIPLWKEIRAPVTVIQGGKDQLVHPGNAAFAKDNIINAPVEVVLKEDVNHFIPWNNPELIKAAIVKHLDMVSQVDPIDISSE